MYVQGAIHRHRLLALTCLEQINQLCLGRGSLFSNLEGNHFMLGDNRVNDGTRRTLTASSGCWDDTKDEINAHTRSGRLVLFPCPI